MRKEVFKLPYRIWVSLCLQRFSFEMAGACFRPLEGPTELPGSCKEVQLRVSHHILESPS